MSLLYVLLGGAVGAPLRYGLQLALPASGGLPVATGLANLAGAFALGVLLELLRPYADTGARRAARLGLGTGLLGSFTTYSALAVETSLLVDDGRAGLAVLYALGSAVGGVVAAALGVGLVAAARR